MSIFQNSVLKTFKQDEKLVASRWASFQNYKTKIEDNIKDIRKKEFFEQFLNFEDENKFDSKISTKKPS